uniref:Uncharacterized protein n=1 Tax=Arundo donax TaxID=35708 RepID=A0A0A8ZI59_ARUDO
MHVSCRFRGLLCKDITNLHIKGSRYGRISSPMSSQNAASA